MIAAGTPTVLPIFYSHGHYERMNNPANLIPSSYRLSVLSLRLVHEYTLRRRLILMQTPSTQNHAVGHFHFRE
jgi:hypothetical protein